MEKTREELIQSRDELFLQEIARVTEENLQEINRQISAFQEDD
jgi:hypothetical protein